MPDYNIADVVSHEMRTTIDSTLSIALVTGLFELSVVAVILAVVEINAPAHYTPTYTESADTLVTPACASAELAVNASRRHCDRMLRLYGMQDDMFRALMEAFLGIALITTIIQIAALARAIRNLNGLVRAAVDYEEEREQEKERAE